MLQGCWFKLFVAFNFKNLFFFKSWLILFLDALGIDAKVLRKFRGGVTICVVNDIGWCAFTHKLGYFLVGLI